MNLPASVGVAMVALVLGGNGLALAAHFFWRRHRSIFWVVSTLIVVGVGYLVATGAAEDVARSLWPIPFDPVKTKEYELRAPCETPRVLGFMLIVGPIVAVLAPVLLFKFGHRPTLIILVSFVFSVCFLLLFVSPIPEKLARSVFSEDMLKVPSHCWLTNQ